MRMLLWTILLEWWALNVGTGVDLTKSLGSPRFKARQQAAKSLEAAWPYSDASLKRTAETSDDPEAAETAKKIRERCWKRCLADAPWADFPLWDPERKFWVGSRCPPLQRAIERRLPYATGYPWENYREVTRQWALQSLQQGYTTPALIKLWFQIGRMVDADYERSRPAQPLPVGEPENN